MKKYEENVIKAMPMYMMIFITSASILGGFNIISPQLMVDFNLEHSTVSMLSMIGLLVMGIASVIYSTLSDNVSIKKLTLIGIGLFNLGAILAIAGSYVNFYAFVAGVAIMVCGGTCGSGLMIVTATKYLSEEKHSKYYGYNTACVGISGAVGILAGGFISTYIGWRLIFALPFISLLTIPSIKKYVPDERGESDKKLDIIGLSLLGLFTLFISLFFSITKISILVIAVILLIVFFIYISKNEKAFISISFFKNKRFVILNMLALVVFGLQSAFGFVFPFLAQEVYGMELAKVSLVMFPTFLASIIVGANSGKIVEKLGAFKTLLVAIICAVCSSVIAGLFVDKGVFMIGLAAVIYTASFAFTYAPFMKLVTNTLEVNQLGVGIGFFNLMTGIGPSLFIAISGKMMSMPALANGIGLVSKGIVYSNIFLVYAILLVISFVVLSMSKKSYNK